MNEARLNTKPRCHQMPRDTLRYLGLVCSWHLACRKCSSLTCVFLTLRAYTMRMHHWNKEVSKLSVASSASPKSYVLCGLRILQTVCGAFLKSQLSERSTPRVVLSLLLWVLKSLWQCWCRWRQRMESLSCSYLLRDRRCLWELLRLALQLFLVVMVCTCSDERCNPKRICLLSWMTLTWNMQPWLNGLHIVHITLHRNPLHWCFFVDMLVFFFASAFNPFSHTHTHAPTNFRCLTALEKTETKVSATHLWFNLGRVQLRRRSRFSLLANDRVVWKPWSLRTICSGGVARRAFRTTLQQSGRVFDICHQTLPIWSNLHHCSWLIPE